MKIVDQINFWEQKYPSLFAACSFILGFIGPIFWVAIAIPITYFISRKQKESIFIWCLLPFCFGLYSYQYQQQLDQYWLSISKQEGFLACHVEWDQDARIDHQLNKKGWAWVTPLEHQNEVKSLKKRFWVEIPEGSQIDTDPALYLKGSSFYAWCLPQNYDPSFPNLKIAIDKEYLNITITSKIRQYLLDKLATWQSQAHSSGFAFSLLTGNKQYVNTSTMHDFNRLGIMALLALSGLHVGIVFNLIKKFSPFGSRHLVTMISGLGLVVIYLFLAAWPLSMLRAFMMLIIYLGCDFLGRRSNGLNALVFLALWECIYNPYVVNRLDFQLSYLGVFGIFWMIHLSKALFMRKNWWMNLVKMYLISWGAMLWTWPIVHYYFGKVPLLSWWLAPPLFAFFGIVVIYCLFLATLEFTQLFSLNALWKPIDLALSLFQQLSSYNSWMSPWTNIHMNWLLLYYACLILIGLLASVCHSKEEETMSLEMAF